MWYLVYEDYEDFFIGEKPPVEVPKNFKSLDELLEFAIFYDYFHFFFYPC